MGWHEHTCALMPMFVIIVSFFQIYQCCLTYRSISTQSGILRSCRSLWRTTITSKKQNSKNIVEKNVGQLRWIQTFYLIISDVVTEAISCQENQNIFYPVSNFIVCCQARCSSAFPKTPFIHIINFVMRNSQRVTSSWLSNHCCCFFRLSQKIEPGTSTPRANASKEDLAGKLSV